MTAPALSMSDLLRNYKDAKTPDEMGIAILDMVRQSQEQNKAEILQEVNLNELATKKDLELSLEKLKSSLIKSIATIIVVGIWVPVLVGGVVKYIGT